MDAQFAMRWLPQALLDHHVWPRLHELHLQPTLAAIRGAGPSLYEDLPDLLAWAGGGNHGWEETYEEEGPPGWSQRVSEFFAPL